MPTTTKNILVAVVGPTAVGKTKLAIELAKHYRTEIISADSRQFYKELSVGTAKPSDAEMSEVPHHFVSSHSIAEGGYSAGDFEKDALAKLADLFSRRQVAILVGGSGLFVRAVCEGLDDLPVVAADIRQKLNDVFRLQGIAPLQDRLKAIEPRLEGFDIQNPQRVIRALEVYEATGKPISYFQQRAKAQRPFDVVTIGLNMPRPLLYDRINQRVDQMLQNGLIDEAKSVLPYRHQPALLTVGYSELFAHFDGEYTLEQAIEKIKQNSRRYAKRQITWFNKYGNTIWYSPDQVQQIIAYVDEKSQNTVQ